MADVEARVPRRTRTAPGRIARGAALRPGVFLWTLVALQAVAGLYFLWTILAALLGLPELPLRWQARELLDLAAALGLVLGAALSIRLALQATRARARADTARRLTAGAFTEVVNDYFRRLGLTEAERDVAWYIVKGIPLAEIARLRGTAEGTVRVQSTAIYRKAGVNGKSQLVSLIVEDLLL